MPDKRNVSISFTVNGEQFDDLTVSARQHLGDLLRSQGFTGTHIGCEQGACGACTIEMDGKAVRSCLILSSQANGSNIKTVEGYDYLLTKKSLNSELEFAGDLNSSPEMKLHLATILINKALKKLEK